MRIIRPLIVFGTLISSTFAQGPEVPSQFARNRSVRGESFIYYNLRYIKSGRLAFLVILGQEAFPPMDAEFATAFLGASRGERVVLTNEKSLEVKVGHALDREGIEKFLARRFHKTPIEVTDPEDVIEMRGPWKITRKPDGYLSAYAFLRGIACLIDEKRSFLDRSRTELRIVVENQPGKNVLSRNQTITFDDEGTLSNRYSWDVLRDEIWIVPTEYHYYEEIFCWYEDDLPWLFLQYIHPSFPRPEKVALAHAYKVRPET